MTQIHTAARGVDIPNDRTKALPVLRSPAGSVVLASEHALRAELVRSSARHRCPSLRNVASAGTAAMQRDFPKQQCTSCLRWYKQLKNNESRGCEGRAASDSDDVDSCPPSDAAPSNADLTHDAVTDVCVRGDLDELCASRCTAAQHQLSHHESDLHGSLYTEVQNHIARKLQQMHTQRHSCDPEPTLESEIMSFLLQHLSGKAVLGDELQQATHCCSLFAYLLQARRSLTSLTCLTNTISPVTVQARVSKMCQLGINMSGSA